VSLLASNICGLFPDILNISHCAGVKKSALHCCVLIDETLVPNSVRRVTSCPCRLCLPAFHLDRTCIPSGLEGLCFGILELCWLEEPQFNKCWWYSIYLFKGILPSCCILFLSGAFHFWVWQTSPRRVEGESRQPGVCWGGAGRWFLLTSN
jgi:hypothetical protein